MDSSRGVCGVWLGGPRWDYTGRGFKAPVASKRPTRTGDALSWAVGSLPLIHVEHVLVWMHVDGTRSGRVLLRNMQTTETMSARNASLAKVVRMRHIS